MLPKAITGAFFMLTAQNQEILITRSYEDFPVLEAGLEPAQPQWPRDFKSLVSTDSTIRASIQRRAENETRTRDPNLGKVMLYQLSYFRVNGCKCKEFYDILQTFRPFSFNIFSFLSVQKRFLCRFYRFKVKARNYLIH